jgi:ABC-type Na+ efflux pump permease subunit
MYISEKKMSEKNDQKKDDKNEKTTVQIFGLFMFVWIVLGLAAFVWSIYCFGKTGSMLQKLVGLIMAVFFGPLFFVLYKFSPTYCK